MKNIPIISITEETLAMAYEKALVQLYQNGTRFKTQYDKEGDPLSIDATANIVVLNPLKDPMIHKAFPGGISNLREYFLELSGLKDSWTKNINDPKDTRWEYLYSQRLRKYGKWKEKIDGKSKEAGYFEVDQIESMIEKLIKQPYTRQSQAITFMPNIDIDAYDMPCLQRIWCRIMEDENGVWCLNTNIHFRSNDSFKAFFYNAFGLIIFVKTFILDEIAKRTNRKIEMGRLCWMADSWHVYGKDIEELEKRLLDKIETTKFEDRVYNFYDPMIQEMYYEDDDKIKEKIRLKTEEFKKTYDVC